MASVIAKLVRLVSFGWGRDLFQGKPMNQELERYRRKRAIWQVALLIGIAAAIVIAALWSLDGR
jgi:hypothetical protein